MSYPQVKEICETLDLIHLMTYDLHGGWESTIGHHAPYTSDGKHPNDPHNHLTVKGTRLENSFYLKRNINVNDFERFGGLLDQEGLPTGENDNRSWLVWSRV